MEYKDKSYWDKREIWRKDYSENSYHKNAVIFLAKKVKENLKEPILKKFLDVNLIIDFLIEGYLVFVSDECGNWMKKDPCNLVPRLDEHMTTYWELWAWKDVIGEYKTSDVLYITFHEQIYSSLIEMLYLGGLNSVELYEPSKLLYYTNMVVDSLTTYFLNIDKILKANKELKRAYKVKKLMKECEQERILD